VYISRIWGEETPYRIEPNFFLVKGIHDVITHVKFGERGSGVVAGRISAFFIDFAGRPYNTLTLLYERVMACMTALCRCTAGNVGLKVGIDKVESPRIERFS